MNFQKWLSIRLENVKLNINNFLREPEPPNLKFEKTNSKKVKEIFRSSEIIFHGFKKLTDKIDASPIIVQYAKGFETILHEELLSEFAPLIAKYRKKYFNKKTATEFHDKFGNIMQNKSISLGAWVKIIRDIKNPQDYPEIQEFNDCLNRKFDDITLRKIRKTCEIMADLRNPRSHNMACSIEEIIIIRKRIIKILNPIIQLFYFPSTNDVHRPMITNFSQYKSWLIDRVNRIEQLLEHV